MTTAGTNDGQAVVLSAQDAALIRQALTAASAVFAQAKTASEAPASRRCRNA